MDNMGFNYLCLLNLLENPNKTKCLKLMKKSIELKKRWGSCLSARALLNFLAILDSFCLLLGGGS